MIFAVLFPNTPPATRAARKIQPEREKLAIGVYRAPTLQPFESLVPNPINRPPIANKITSLKVIFNSDLNVALNVPANNRQIIVPNTIPVF